MHGAHTRSLLRLRKIAARAAPAIGAVRSIQTILPPQQLSHRPSPIASSSRITLDHIPLAIDYDPLSNALIYAQDEELVGILLADSSSNPDWTTGLDPASAYLCLRTRTTFSHYLAYLTPRIEQIHRNLLPSGLHRFLVSDLLLRHPDPECLRKILRLDTHASPDQRLPGNLVITIYGFLRQSARRGLSRSLHLSVLPALKAENATDLLLAAYGDLSTTTVWEPDGTWIHLDILLHLSRQGENQHCLRLLQKLVADGHVPRTALGKSNLKHTQAIPILICSVILRCCLQWRLYDRAQQIVAEELLKIVKDSEPSPGVFDLLLETCRGAIASTNPDHSDWAGTLLIDLCSTNGNPPLPNAIIDSYLSSVSPDAGLEFYRKLPRPPPESLQPSPYLASPANLIALAHAANRSTFMGTILPDIDRHPDMALAPYRKALLKLSAGAEVGSRVRRYLNRWYFNDKNTLEISGPLFLDLIACLIRSEVDSRASQRLMEAFDLHSTQRERLYLIPANLMLGKVDVATELLKECDPDLDTINKLVISVSKTSVLPALATIALYSQVSPCNETPTPGPVVLAAMASGQWHLVKEQKHLLTPDETKELRVMKTASFGQFTKSLSVLQWLITRDRPFSHSTLRFVMLEAAQRSKWDEGARSWTMAMLSLPQTISMRARREGNADVSHRLMKLGTEYIEKLRRIMIRSPSSDVPPLVDKFAGVRTIMEPHIERYACPHHRAAATKVLNRFEDTARRLCKAKRGSHRNDI